MLSDIGWVHHGMWVVCQMIDSVRGTMGWGRAPMYGSASASLDDHVDRAARQRCTIQDAYSDGLVRITCAASWSTLHSITTLRIIRKGAELTST